MSSSNKLKPSDLAVAPSGITANWRPEYHRDQQRNAAIPDTTTNFNTTQTYDYKGSPIDADDD